MSVPIPYETLGGIAVKGVRSAIAARQWRRQIGVLIYGGIVRALEIQNPEHDQVGYSASIIAESLGRIERPGSGGKGFVQPLVKASKKLVNKGTPPISSLGPSFEEYLEIWMREAMVADPNIANAITDATGTALANQAESFPGLFVGGFLLELCEDPGEALPRIIRDTLVQELKSAEETRLYIDELRSRAQRLLTATAGGVGAAAAVGVHDLLSINDAAAAGVGLGAAALVVLLGEATQRFRRRPSDPRTLLEGILRQWLADLFSCLAGRDVKATSDALTTAYDHILTSGAPPSSQPDACLEALTSDLSKRLIRRAETLGDDGLISVLWRLEDALIRWNREPHNPLVSTGIYAPLLELLNLTRAFSGSDESASGKSPSGDGA